MLLQASKTAEFYSCSIHWFKLKTLFFKLLLKGNVLFPQANVTVALKHTLSQLVYTGFVLVITLDLNNQLWKAFILKIKLNRYKLKLIYFFYAAYCCNYININSSFTQVLVSLSYFNMSVSALLHITLFVLFSVSEKFDVFVNAKTTLTWRSVKKRSYFILLQCRVYMHNAK